MDINVFLVCHNESALLPHTVNHYKKNLPSCKITVHDNGSSDNSVELAESLGCKVLHWDTGGKTNEKELVNLKNECWKVTEKGWVIVGDMDEFLCVTEEDLKRELEAGTTILNIQGYDMVGESKTEDLTDIDLHSIKKYFDSPGMSKRMCFLRGKVTDIHYDYGAHSAYPKGELVFSSTVYMNKHMNKLGLPFVTKRTLDRFHRSHDMRQILLDTHYTDDVAKIEREYLALLASAKTLA